MVGSGAVGIFPTDPDPTIVSDTESLQMVGKIPIHPGLIQTQGRKKELKNVSFLERVGKMYALFYQS